MSEENSESVKDKNKREEEVDESENMENHINKEKNNNQQETSLGYNLMEMEQEIQSNSPIEKTLGEEIPTDVSNYADGESVPGGPLNTNAEDENQEHYEDDEEIDEQQDDINIEDDDLEDELQENQNSGNKEENMENNDDYNLEESYNSLKATNSLTDHVVQVGEKDDDLFTSETSRKRRLLEDNDTAFSARTGQKKKKNL